MVGSSRKKWKPKYGNQNRNKICATQKDMKKVMQISNYLQQTRQNGDHNTVNTSFQPTML